MWYTEIILLFPGISCNRESKKNRCTYTMKTHLMQHFFPFCFLFCMLSRQNVNYESVLNKSTLHHITCAHFNIIVTLALFLFLSLNTHNINMKTHTLIKHTHIIHWSCDTHLCFHAFWFLSIFSSGKRNSNSKWIECIAVTAVE